VRVQNPILLEHLAEDAFQDAAVPVGGEVGGRVNPRDEGQAFHLDGGIWDLTPFDPPLLDV